MEKMAAWDVPGGLMNKIHALVDTRTSPRQSPSDTGGQIAEADALTDELGE
nr:hypothetical protein [Sinorhizobium medicae]